MDASAKKLSKLFEKQSKPTLIATREEGEYVHLNFFLVTEAIKHIHKAESAPTPLFTKEICSSKNEGLKEMIKQAESCCSKQDLSLLSYKQFSLRDDLSLRRIIEWKLSKYVKGESEVKALIQMMKHSSPDNFKHHLITLLKDGEGKLSVKELEASLSLLTQPYGEGGPTKVSPI